jgi:hypothetical protein
MKCEQLQKFRQLAYQCLGQAKQQFEFKPATKLINFKDVKKGDYLEMTAYSIDLR